MDDIDRSYHSSRERDKKSKKSQHSRDGHKKSKKSKRSRHGHKKSKRCKECGKRVSKCRGHNIPRKLRRSDLSPLNCPADYADDGPDPFGAIGVYQSYCESRDRKSGILAANEMRYSRRSRNSSPHNPRVRSKPQKDRRSRESRRYSRERDVHDDRWTSGSRRYSRERDVHDDRRTSGSRRYSRERDVHDDRRTSGSRKYSRERNGYEDRLSPASPSFSQGIDVHDDRWASGSRIYLRDPPAYPPGVRLRPEESPRSSPEWPRYSPRDSPQEYPGRYAQGSDWREEFPRSSPSYSPRYSPDSSVYHDQSECTEGMNEHQKIAEAYETKKSIRELLYKEIRDIYKLKKFNGQLYRLLLEHSEPGTKRPEPKKLNGKYIGTFCCLKPLILPMMKTPGPNLVAEDQERQLAAFEINEKNSKPILAYPRLETIPQKICEMTEIEFEEEKNVIEDSWKFIDVKDESQDLKRIFEEIEFFKEHSLISKKKIQRLLSTQEQMRQIYEDYVWDTDLKPNRDDISNIFHSPLNESLNPFEQYPYGPNYYDFRYVFLRRFEEIYEEYQGKFPLPRDD